MKRLPIIRHLRYLIGLYRVNRHYDRWAQFGRFPIHRHLDYQELDEIWRGKA